jgi:hypothetical protein
MKRASYRQGVDWIARFDASRDGDSEGVIACYITTTLLADLFDIPPERVARDVARVRARLDAEQCEACGPAWTLPEPRAKV